MPRKLNLELEEAGKRIADQINARVRFNDPVAIRHCWMAFALSDGTSRGELFESLAEAKKYTDETRTAYFAMIGVMGGITPFDAAVYLGFCREARDANLMHADPNRVAVMTNRQSDIMRGRLN
jgi:hypothetical protein